jgi:hypothetical protein
MRDSSGMTGYTKRKPITFPLTSNACDIVHMGNPLTDTPSNGLVQSLNCHRMQRPTNPQRIRKCRRSKEFACVRRWHKPPRPVVCVNPTVTYRTPTSHMMSNGHPWPVKSMPTSQIHTLIKLTPTHSPYLWTCPASFPYLKKRTYKRRRRKTPPRVAYSVPSPHVPVSSTLVPDLLPGGQSHLEMR